VRCTDVPGEEDGLADGVVRVALVVDSELDLEAVWYFSLYVTISSSTLHCCKSSSDGQLPKSTPPAGLRD
jgi:hypothetical protein